MKKIITAIGNPILNKKLKEEKDIQVIGNDIQYQDGIFEILEKNNNINFIIINELLNGELLINQLIEKIIKLINKKIKLIIILDKPKEELENLLISKGVFKIIYNNELNIDDFIKIIKEEKIDDENEEIKKEINNLKKLIIENQNINMQNTNIKNEYFIENILKNNLKEKNEEKIISKIKINIYNFFNKKNKLIYKENKEKNSYKKISEEENKKIKSEIISISGPSGVGKSIISINLAKSMMHTKQKILIIDFDILNNNLHTILGVKKYPIKINKKINDSNINNISIEDIIIKINSKINLISATDLLFNNKEKIDLIKIENILNKLKEKYPIIIIDTSSECFFDFTKTIIKLSNKNIFVTETNILEIKKAKELLNIYINEWKIKKEKFNILFNKYDEECISMSLLKELFCEFNIVGVLKYNSKYNKLINQNLNRSFFNKEIKNEYLKINKKI